MVKWEKKQKFRQTHTCLHVYTYTPPPQTLKPPELPACEPKGGVWVSWPCWQVPSQRPHRPPLPEEAAAKETAFLFFFQSRLPRPLPPGTILGKDKMKWMALVTVATLQAHFPITGKAGCIICIDGKELFGTVCACVSGVEGDRRGLVRHQCLV